jgi:hypothetical protein
MLKAYLDHSAMLGATAHFFFIEEHHKRCEHLRREVAGLTLSVEAGGRDHRGLVRRGKQSLPNNVRLKLELLDERRLATAWFTSTTAPRP